MVGESYGGGSTVGGLIVGAGVGGELAAVGAVIREEVIGVDCAAERAAARGSEDEPDTGSDFRSTGVAIVRA